jgi:hypothetical protein
VGANDTSGAHATFTYTSVVNDFTNDLVNQTEGEGQFTVNATLVSIILPNAGVQGTATWLIQSSGTIKRGAKNIATATLRGYISAHLVPIRDTVTLPNTETQSSAPPGVISRGMIQWTSNAVEIDSYRSSKGQYNQSLASNSFPGQIGNKNRGSKGNIRTNNETVAGVNNGNAGYISVKNGTVTGSAYATFQAPDNGGPDGMDAIDIRLGRVGNGQGGDFEEKNKVYGAEALVFPPIAAIPAPTGKTDYAWTSKNNGTLPAGNYRDITVTKGQLTVPPGTYRGIEVASQGTLVLGVAGQQSVYNFQDFSSSAQASITYRGPVTINVQNDLDAGAGSAFNSVVPPSAIRWNFIGGPGKKIEIGGNADVVGVFYAPNSDLEIRGGGDFYGIVAARSVNISGNVGIHVDEDAISGVQQTVTTNVPVTSIVGYTASNYSLWRITQAIN